jgi:putative transposase
MRYIELNPVRAGMVNHPAEYRWSSYRSNAQGESSNLLSSHGVYDGLSGDPEQRRRHYRDLFRYELEPGMVDDIRKAANGGYVLGRDDFKEQIKRALKQRTAPGKPGRPRKTDYKDMSQQSKL